MKRREAIGHLFAGLATAGTAGRQERRGGQDTLVARLSDPSLAGMARVRITDFENDPFVVDVEGKLRCTCGCNLSVYTCRTTDFTCETSPAMHQQVVGMVKDGKTAEEILDAFMMQYGETVLMAPPKRGFNLAAYLVPGLAIVVAGVLLLRRVLRETGIRGSGIGDRGPASAAPAPRSPLPDPRIADELEKLDL